MQRFLLPEEKSSTWSTDKIAERERFDFWSDVVCKKICKLNCNSHTSTPFFGALRYAKFGGLDFLEMQSVPQTFIRTRSHVAEMTNQTMILSLPLTTRSEKTVNCRGLSTVRGDISFYDATRPQKLFIGSPIHALIIQIPKKTMARSLLNVDNYDSNIISSNKLMGYLTSNFIRSLASNLAAGRDECNSAVVSSMVQLIACALNESDKNNLRLPEVKSSLRRSVIQFIETNFHDPCLSPQAIAARFRISPRYLHKLFEEGDHSIAKTIHKCRLKHSRLLLRCESRNWSITDVAYDCGFNDISHFSRSFRKMYGICPRDYRLSDAHSSIEEPDDDL